MPRARRETPEEVMRAVGLRIAELRRARDWTQEQLAEKAQFSDKYEQSIERGDENLTLKSLAKLASLLGVRVADLFATPRDVTRRPGRPPRTTGRTRS